MKKISTLFITLLFISCSQLDHISRVSEFYGYDFRPYTEKGFMITPEMYQGDYESIGMIHYILTPESRIGHVTRVSIDEFGDRKYHKEKVWKTEVIDVSAAIDSMYNQCVTMGADALVNFNVESEVREYTDIKLPVIIKGYHISGFAIKRK